MVHLKGGGVDLNVVILNSDFEGQILVRSAIANEVILLCLPPKTTHITQPLHVAVYRKMKIEAADIISKAKLIKSDLWLSKKKTSLLC